ncbi:DNA mismatch repair protein MutS [Sediminitomix flava]|uniref:DNA mismatch repair protein MutS n=1 Tax=Sediminitomix flava TaxID=379075 RepID=A0A315Z752_SEDFL|nr:DNA mismatch repair protein MutS [Sediminitomix flava]PWJ40772.1 DNA mismatch repair protein MutS [Sediminitomix flava]
MLFENGKPSKSGTLAKKSVKKEKETPMMKQYNAIKAKHPGALLLFRVGDFYETFGEDAIKASQILEIVLTKRSNGAASAMELAGFPHHALDTYLPRLVKAGQRVAICDQLEDPKSVKGVVKRGVTELVTPGVSFNDNVLNVKKNNYLASVYFLKQTVGVSFLDVSTGEFLTAQGDQAYIDKLMQSFMPSEVIYCRVQKEQYEAAFRDDFNSFQLDDWVYTHEYGYDKLLKHFGTNSMKGYGIQNLEAGIVAAGAVLYYLEATEHKNVSHISTIGRIEEDKYVWLDKFTIRNLELLSPQHEGGVPLIQILDKCVTPMGARLLKKWVLLPLKDKRKIEERLNVVRYFKEEEDVLDTLVDSMQQVGDMERLISKVAVGRINPREMVQLKRALQHSLPVKEALAKCDVPELKTLNDRLHSCELLMDKIEKELQNNPPLNATQGGMVNEGVNEELDELRKIAFSGKDYLNQILEREIESTGISSLKIAYNKVFGYYLEVRNVHKDKVPETWIRKQTLVNAERYITEELKTYEEKILHAESQINVLEQQIFQNLVLLAADYVAQIQQNAAVIATLDCLLSFANIANEYNYAAPSINDTRNLQITEGRHPVIERNLPIGEEYIPNDVNLNDSEQQIMIITGPNMAGKSALLRQTALIVLMAQMGCFVPAKAAEVGIVDKVFTRVGASDNLSKGESTFMVEMIETASILNNLSDRSLVLMDEIGRGTSTYDGISIAWSIVEHLHNQKGSRAKTLFATHYHELNQLATDFPRIHNFNVAVKEVGGKVIFLRKLKEGGSEHSFGIHVAQLAGMPPTVVSRANEILSHLEKDKIHTKNKQKLKEVPQASQLTIFNAADPKSEQIKDALEQLDVNALTPIDALLKLNELKKMLS